MLGEDGGWNCSILVSSEDYLPNFINLARCPSGKLLALSFEGALWSRSIKGEWTEGHIETEENVQDVACVENDEIIVSASFSLLLKSLDDGMTWTETSQDEDVMFTQLEFPTVNIGYAFGEFGAVLKTKNAGLTWERLPEVESEFYPLASYFISESRGWVAGLAGVIYQTQNGGQTWQRETSDTQAPIYKITSIGSQLVAAGNYGTFLKRDASGNWRGIDSSKLGTSGYLRVVSSLPKQSKSMLVAGQGFLNSFFISEINSPEAQ